MHYADLVSRMVATVTGRTIDQHALDPVPAAVRIPQATSALRLVRNDVLVAVDAMRTMLINGDDLQSEAGYALRATLDKVADLVRRYCDARRQLDVLIDDDEREHHAEVTPAVATRRRYVTPGDTIIVVLPHSTTCRDLRLAGRSARLRVDSACAEVDPTDRPGPARRLSYDEAGIYHDPDTSRFYVVEPAEPGNDTPSPPTSAGGLPNT